MNLFNQKIRGETVKRTLKYYYAQVENMGDKLNELIARELFGFEIKRHTPITCEISGIGSGLGQFCLSDKLWLSMIERVSGILFPKTYIWGTGFIFQKQKDAPFYRKHMIFQAVRGELSKERCERLLNRELDIPTGDGGILAVDILNKRHEKKYLVGVIAHYKEQNHPVFIKIANMFQDSCLIDMRQEPLTIIEQIDQCEYIISSSLHGLIIADSLSIPNLHIHVTDAMLGDGFKFDDYYSAYGEQHNCIDTSVRTDISIQEIIDSYVITEDAVVKKRKEMREAFPFQGGK